MSGDRLKHLTSRSPEQWASLSAAQSRVLVAMSDYAPGGRLRFTVDLSAGTVEIEPEGEPCPPVISNPAPERDV